MLHRKIKTKMEAHHGRFLLCPAHADQSAGARHSALYHPSCHRPSEAAGSRPPEDVPLRSMPAAPCLPDSRLHLLGGRAVQTVTLPLSLRLYGHLYATAFLPLLLLIPFKKRWLRRIVTGMLCLSIGYCAGYQVLFQVNHGKAHNFTRLGWADGFQHTVEAMRKEYVLSNWKQIDYDALLAEYLPRIEAAEAAGDQTAYGVALAEYAYHFYDLHVGVSMPAETRLAVRDQLAGNDYGLCLYTIDSGETIAVMVAEDGAAYAQGIRNGTVITQWDGVPVAEAAATVECIYVGYNVQFPVRENEAKYRPLFLAGKGGDTIRVSYLDAAGEERTATLTAAGSYRRSLGTAITLLQHDYLQDENFSTKMLSDTCGYLRISEEEYALAPAYLSYLRGGYFPKLTEDVNAKLEALQAQGMQSLVLDLRNNSGGLNAVGTAVSSLFTKERRFQFADGVRNGDSYRTTFHYDVFPDGRWADLPVVVLVNQACMSAGDGAAFFLGQNDNVTLMGITASNGVNQSIGGRCYLRDGFSIKYPVFLTLGEDDLPLIDTDASRKNRIPLDVEIPVDRDAALRIFDMTSDDSDDYALSYAMDYLQETRQLQAQ